MQQIEAVGYEILILVFGSCARTSGVKIERHKLARSRAIKTFRQTAFLLIVFPRRQRFGRPDGYNVIVCATSPLPLNQSGKIGCFDE
jgi:hypothetical protein